MKINIELTPEQLQAITKQARDEGGADSRFDINLLEGKLSENELSQTLETIELKKDYLAYKTGNIYVEYKSRGKWSGICTTKAKYYAYQLVDKNQVSKMFILVEVEALRELVKKYRHTSMDVRGGDNGTSRGIKLPLVELIQNIL